MGRISEKKSREILDAYFEAGMETEEIAKRLRIAEKTVLSVLSDQTRLEPYHKRSEAAKLRAQICVNESAEEAARKQAELLRDGETAQSVTQRAAVDILNRAGVRVAKDAKSDVRITFLGGTPEIGMPKRHEEDA